MEWEKLIISIVASIVITIIGFLLSPGSLLLFCLVIGILGFLLKFIDIHIVDLLPLVVIAPLFYVLLVLLFGNLNLNIVTEVIIFWVKLIPSVIIGNVASEILFSIGIR